MANIVLVTPLKIWEIFDLFQRRNGQDDNMSEIKIGISLGFTGNQRSNKLHRVIKGGRCFLLLAIGIYVLLAFHIRSTLWSDVLQSFIQKFEISISARFQIFRQNTNLWPFANDIRRLAECNIHCCERCELARVIRFLAVEVCLGPYVLCVNIL